MICMKTFQKLYFNRGRGPEIVTDPLGALAVIRLTPRAEMSGSDLGVSFSCSNSIL